MIHTVHDEERRKESLFLSKEKVASFHFWNISLIWRFPRALVKGDGVLAMGAFECVHRKLLYVCSNQLNSEEITSFSLFFYSILFFSSYLYIISLFFRYPGCYKRMRSRNPKWELKFRIWSKSSQPLVWWMSLLDTPAWKERLTKWLTSLRLMVGYNIYFPFFQFLEGGKKKKTANIFSGMFSVLSTLLQFIHLLLSIYFFSHSPPSPFFFFWLNILIAHGWLCICW